MQRISGIYKIGFLGTSKVYIGSSVNINSRLYNHLRKLRNNTHSNMKLQEYYNKSKDTIYTEVVIECSENKLTFEEARLINENDSYNNGFNLTKNTVRTKVEEVDYCAVYKTTPINRVLVSTELVHEKGLSLAESMVYCILLTISDDSMKCTLSINSIADLVGISGKSVSRIIKTLEQKGLIDYNTIRHKSSCVNTYILNVPFNLKTGEL